MKASRMPNAFPDKPLMPMALRMDLKVSTSMSRVILLNSGSLLMGSIIPNFDEISSEISNLFCSVFVRVVRVLLG